MASGATCRRAAPPAAHRPHSRHWLPPRPWRCERTGRNDAYACPQPCLPEHGAKVAGSSIARVCPEKAVRRGAIAADLTTNLVDSAKFRQLITSIIVALNPL